MDILAQKKRILDYLRTGHMISCLDAIRKFGCLNLKARLHELRVYDNWDILRVDVKKKKGRGRYGKWYLAGSKKS